MFHYRNRKFLILISILIIIGVCAIYSASYVFANLKYGDGLYYVKRQLIFVLVGYCIMFFISNLNISNLRKYSKGIMLFCIIMMILVLFIGTKRNGSRSWFKIGSFLIQPSEFTKFGLIIYISDYLASKYRIKKLFKDLFKPMLITGICFLLIMLQPDFGSGMVMCCGVMILVIVAGLPMRYFAYIGMLGVSGIVALIMAAPYRLARITSFLDPFADPLGAGFQSIQSLFAIAPGGLFGLGFLNSMQKHFYLPEPHTDFIFAIICEELGFFGGLLIILMFVLILSEGIKIVNNLHDTFYCLVVLGILSLSMIQVIINLGVVVGLFPITGITLPFISYGGSSLCIMMASMGLIMAINKAQSDK